MVFSSIVFLFRFLPIFFILYFIAPWRMRNLILFLGSLFFYAWGEPVYVVLMLFSTLSDFIHGILIEKYKGTPASKAWLLSSIAINLGLLGFFKYSGADVPLPIGISFYTFQTMSYSIDVYLGQVKAQRNLLNFGVFVSMFPQLIAGPIVKYHTIDEALQNRRFTLSEAELGIRRFLLGLGKKVLLANNIGLLFTEVVNTPKAELTGLMAFLGILAFSLQLYFDFSGYSDMAIGLGKIMGFSFPENFNYPYIARSITDFWRRWHISLSSWFREYVYIPLGGNKKGKARQLLNIFIVWSLTGVWHGAGLPFLLWGMWFAFFLILEKLFLGKCLERAPKVLGWLYAMAVVFLGWVFFSLEKTELIVSFLQAMTGLSGAGWVSEKTLYLWENYRGLFGILAVAATPLGKWFASFLEKKAGRIFPVTEMLYLCGILALSIANIVDNSYNPFLYFRF